MTTAEERLAELKEDELQRAEAAEREILAGHEVTLGVDDVVAASVIYLLKRQRDGDEPDDAMRWAQVVNCLG